MSDVPVLSFADPYPWYAHMRKEAPIYYVPRFRSHTLFRYADVVAALREPRLSSRITGVFFRRLPPEVQSEMRDFQRILALWMLFRDPPDHARVRGLAMRAFTPRMVAGLAPRIEALTTELLDATESRADLDIVRDLAKPLPVLVIAELLGVEPKDRELLKQWSDDLATFLDTRRTAVSSAAQCNESFKALSAYLLDTAERRRREPRDDLLSALVAPSSSAPSLTDDELVAMGISLLFAGHETTTNLIGNGALALLRHPKARERFLSDSAIQESTIEELLRYDSPVQAVWRIAREDFTFLGAKLHEGDIVFPRIGSANRDEAQFQKPDQLAIDRQDNRHLAFGLGSHFCIGAALSRLEGRIALRALFARYPSLEFSEDTLCWTEHSSFHGLLSFPVVRTDA